MERDAQTVIVSFQITIVLTDLLIHALKLVVVHTIIIIIIDICKIKQDTIMIN